MGKVIGKTGVFWSAEIVAGPQDGHGSVPGTRLPPVVRCGHVQAGAERSRVADQAAGRAAAPGRTAVARGGAELFRVAAVAALGGAAFAAALADVRALVWATIALALPVVALSDEVARRTGPR